MIKKLAIVGASGHGKVIADIAEQLGYTVNFYDDAYPNKKKIEHWFVIGTFSDMLNVPSTNINVVVAIGHNNTREVKMKTLAKNGYTLPILIHPSAIISKYAQIDSGSVIAANAVINAFAVIGRGCIINTSAIIEHDCKIDDFTHICPGTVLAGGVSVGRSSWVGIGSKVKQLINIGDNTLIGAGSLVVKDIPSGVIAYGSPCIKVSENS
ncbi:acetyltransferase [Pseudoalteromonas sp. SWYJZ12]|uniref:acetyltransferase n=1 Tax=Pseudoalteromonas sp. SWYJZ12 TaxID=2792067 RepID=UPI0018CC9B09|nr:acetyltransferase [Pseudoalteromonas sp. SWYJZ12]MBH0002716.1 acetyltransferase [Pseudoalteromonas sp. SWYJZ12]